MLLVPRTNPVPVIVPPAPAVISVGVIEVMVGTAEGIVHARAEAEQAIFAGDVAGPQLLESTATCD